MLTNQLDMPNEARVTNVVGNLRVVQVEVNQHQISRRDHVAVIVHTATRVLANKLRHPSISSVANADALGRARKHEIVQIELYLVIFLNLFIRGRQIAFINALWVS